MIVEAIALALSVGLPDVTKPAVYRPAERAVSNWRAQAAVHVDAPGETLARLLGLGEVRALPRCVRLNNYWCVKSAKWSGEIAADGEGHVAFSSAREGALVAAQLLRRYYVDYGRKTALSIISRWAPAECVAAPPRPMAQALARRTVGAAPSQPDGLSTRGIQNTMRARWLAANRGRVSGGRMTASRPAPRASAQKPVPLMRAPAIAVGMGEKAQPTPAEIRIAPVRLASLGLPGPPRVACAGDSARIRNYAASLARGIAESPTADLKLFDAAGMPTPALAQAMANMAAVEIGPLKATDGLIAAAIDDQTTALRERLGIPPAP